VGSRKSQYGGDATRWIKPSPSWQEDARPHKCVSWQPSFESRRAAPNQRWCALKVVVYLPATPVVIATRRLRSRRPVQSGDWIC
jgi:hypothetical protein